MTTPDIPEAAIQAAAEVLQRAEANHDAPNPVTTDIAWWCRDVAADMLAAALPLLGDTTTEYTVRIDRLGSDPYVLGDAERLAIHSTRAAADASVDRLRDAWTMVTVVQRTVITGEWTEAPSE